MKKVLILPGYGRCGTLSYREFFEGHPDINVITNQGVPWLSINLLRSYLDDDKLDNVVVSEPRLTNHPQHIEVWADTFQRYAPDARIIFTYRPILENVQAWYQSNYYNNEAQTIVSFPKFLKGLWQEKNGSFLGALHPKNSIRYYTDRFKDVELYEMSLDLATGRAFKEICTYLEVPFVDVPLSMRHNRKASRIRTYEYIRNFLPFSFGGRVRNKLENFLSRGKRLNPEFSKEWRERLEEYYYD